MARPVRELLEGLGAKPLASNDVEAWRLDASALGLSSVFGGALVGDARAIPFSDEAFRFEAPDELAQLGVFWVPHLERAEQLRAAIKDAHERLARRLSQELARLEALGFAPALAPPWARAQARGAVGGHAAEIAVDASGQLQLCRVDGADVGEPHASLGADLESAAEAALKARIKERIEKLQAEGRLPKGRGAFDAETVRAPLSVSSRSGRSASSEASHDAADGADAGGDASDDLDVDILASAEGAAAGDELLPPPDAGDLSRSERDEIAALLEDDEDDEGDFDGERSSEQPTVALRALEQEPLSDTPEPDEEEPALDYDEPTRVLVELPAQLKSGVAFEDEEVELDDDGPSLVDADAGSGEAPPASEAPARPEAPSRRASRDEPASRAADAAQVDDVEVDAVEVDAVAVDDVEVDDVEVDDVEVDDVESDDVAARSAEAAALDSASDAALSEETSDLSEDDPTVAIQAGGGPIVGAGAPGLYDGSLADVSEPEMEPAIDAAGELDVSLESEEAGPVGEAADEEPAGEEPGAGEGPAIEAAAPPLAPATRRGRAAGPELSAEDAPLELTDPQRPDARRRSQTGLSERTLASDVGDPLRPRGDGAPAPASLTDLASVVGEGLSTGKTGAIQLDAEAFAYLARDDFAEADALEQEAALLESRARELRSRAEMLRRRHPQVAVERPQRSLKQRLEGQREADAAAPAISGEVTAEVSKLGASVEISDELQGAASLARAARELEAASPGGADREAGRLEAASFDDGGFDDGGFDDGGSGREVAREEAGAEEGDAFSSGDLEPGSLDSPPDARDPEDAFSDGVALEDVQALLAEMADEPPAEATQLHEVDVGELHAASDGGDVFGDGGDEPAPAAATRVAAFDSLPEAASRDVHIAESEDGFAYTEDAATRVGAPVPALPPERPLEDVRVDVLADVLEDGDEDGDEDAWGQEGEAAPQEDREEPRADAASGPASPRISRRPQVAIVVDDERARARLKKHLATRFPELRDLASIADAARVELAGELDAVVIVRPSLDGHTLAGFEQLESLGRRPPTLVLSSDPGFDAVPGIDLRLALARRAGEVAQQVLDGLERLGIG